jgi:hypothetical protein
MWWTTVDDGSVNLQWAMVDNGDVNQWSLGDGSSVYWW